MWQGEFARNCSLAVAVGPIVFAGNEVLGSLSVHEPLPPLPLDGLMGHLVATCCRANLLDREFGCPVGIQQTIGFLIGVRELRVTKAGECRRGADRFQQSGIRLGKLLRRIDSGVAPGSAWLAGI